MRDLIAVTLECMEMLDDIGIKYGNIDDVVVNTRARSRWGSCKRMPNLENFTISINADLHRMCESIKHPEFFFCGKCDGKLTRVQ